MHQRYIITITARSRNAPRKREGSFGPKETCHQTRNAREEVGTGKAQAAGFDGSPSPIVNDQRQGVGGDDHDSFSAVEDGYKCSLCRAVFGNDPGYFN